MITTKYFLLKTTQQVLFTKLNHDILPNMERGSKESEPKEKIQGIIFDADGVILNGERIDIHLEHDFVISRLKDI